MTPPMFAELPSRALIALSGPDWRSFLQGQVTHDVETLAVGEARFAGLLTPQGRLLWDLFVVGRADGCWLDVAAEHRAAIVQRLSMFRLRAKVEIAPDEAGVAVLFSARPGEGRGPDDEPGALRSGSRPSPGRAGEIWVADPRLPELGLRGYGAAAPAEAVVADEAAYDAHRLALGVPGTADWGSDKTYPIEANFDLLHGIDFKKGCFVGQETTSRMKRRGQIKTRMLPIVFDGPPPPPGAEVLAGTLRAGEVCAGIDGRAIAMLRLDRIAGGLEVDGRPVRVERPAWIAEALGEHALG
ncbi:CAF17-like 4Fe-4S cluster assembly/insertion protein YgfZ [Phenylobacterium sp. LjRoot219]|uniref:CAF17-like 4Fe-4S cluster assembly/insertion protein YgfZ n=1 Tax=Phenylobacterium sp. LjRoot219 TaxID=3342283 RepID=UPI003F4FD074